MAGGQIAAPCCPLKGWAVPGQAYMRTAQPGCGLPREVARGRDNAAVPRVSLGPGHTVAGTRKEPVSAGGAWKARSSPCSCRPPHMFLSLLLSDKFGLLSADRL